MARPSKYSDALAKTICERLIDSDYGLEQVCEADDMPGARTIYSWLADIRYQSFQQQYARARQAQAHVQADRGTKEALNATDASLGRLKWDARRWQASKLNAKAYGDKTALVGGTKGEDEPIQSETKLDVSNLTDAQLKALAAIKIEE